jgi:MerR family transcriptional regulator, thiopeptide resistance regulator
VTTWSIAEVARMSKITARTLRHYDAIGLLPPAETGPGGVRRYGPEELMRLQRILLLRDLGLGLDAVARVLEQQTGRAEAHILADHRAWLLAESGRLARLAATVQRTIDGLQQGADMTDVGLFDGFDPGRYEAEVEQRWPEQAAEARRRTAGWTKEDFERVAREGVESARSFSALRAEGLAADDPRVQETVAKHYEGVCRFWTPSAEAYRGLGEMYVADERFRQYYDKYGEGTAEFVRDAIGAYARRELS